MYTNIVTDAIAHITQRVTLKNLLRMIGTMILLNQGIKKRARLYNIQQYLATNDSKIKLGPFYLEPISTLSYHERYVLFGKTTSTLKNMYDADNIFNDLEENCLVTPYCSNPLTSSGPHEQKNKLVVHSETSSDKIHHPKIRKGYQIKYGISKYLTNEMKLNLFLIQ